jgi:1,4-alpha-glucan branching enzyme
MSKTSKKDIGVILHRDRASFRVWAPFATAVDVTGAFNNWGRTPMVSEEDGYWAVDIKNVEAGQEYKYVIHTPNGELFKNDPRALHVTITAGNSVVVDTQFEWSDDNYTSPPLNQQVMYEMHIGTFYREDPSATGTFQDAMKKLDYLADLGINMIELMPINSMSNDRGWGYTTDYPYAVESLYGGRRAFMEFVNAAHQKGIGVILDIVYNHFGPDGGLDMWQFDGWSQDGKGGIYFYNDWRAHTPWGDTRPDYGREEVRQYILDNARMWLRDCHVDGLRVDSTGFIRTVNGHNNDPGDDISEGWWLLQQLTNMTRKVKPSATMVAEDLGCNEYLTKPASETGAGFSAQWEVGMPFVLRGALDPIDDAYRHLGDLSHMLEHRYNGDAFRRVIYSDSHDSAANGGARLSEEISPHNPGSLYSQRRSLLGTSVILTAPGLPMLFQGQEFLEGGSFNDWQALEWERAEKFPGMVLAAKHLIALRRNLYGNSRGLSGQSFTILHLNEEDKVMAYHRWDQGGPGDDVIVVLNLANRVQKDYYIPFPRTGLWRVRFNGDWKGYSAEFKDTKFSEVAVQGESAPITIAPYSALILSQEPNAA